MSPMRGMDPKSISTGLLLLSLPACADFKGGGGGPAEAAMG